ncbi:UDP-4-amino-4,6-dideoxy-N-acetyl-beta-L-altrosamine N-acetyltransferase [Roseivivax sp. CAU 1753]
MDGIALDRVGCLRQFRDDDLEMVLPWRNMPSVRANMYTQHEISLSEHIEWWRQKKNCRSEAYFIYEHSGEPQGVVSFSNFDDTAGTSFWAFYAGPAAPKGTGTIMEYLALELYFSKFRMRKLSCEVLAFNVPVLNLHRKFGFLQEGCFKEHVRIDGQYVDVHRLALFGTSWRKDSERILAKILQRMKS